MSDTDSPLRTTVYANHGLPPINPIAGRADRMAPPGRVAGEKFRQPGEVVRQPGAQPAGDDAQHAERVVGSIEDRNLQVPQPPRTFGRLIHGVRPVGHPDHENAPAVPGVAQELAPHPPQSLADTAVTALAPLAVRLVDLVPA